MAWVVDTAVLLDIHLDDPSFAQASAACLLKHAADGLTISPVTYVELAPAFGGDAALQEQFLAGPIQSGRFWLRRRSLRNLRSEEGAALK